MCVCAGQLYLDAIRKCCSVICRTRHRPSFDRHQGATTHGRSSSNGPMHQRNKFQLEMATLDQAVKECSTAFDPVTNIATPNVDYLALPGCGSPNLLSTSSLGSRLFLSGDECTSNFGSCSPPPITRATTIISSPAVTPQWLLVHRNHVIVTQSSDCFDSSKHLLNNYPITREFITGVVCNFTITQTFRLIRAAYKYLFIIVCFNHVQCVWKIILCLLFCINVSL